MATTGIFYQGRAAFRAAFIIFELMVIVAIIGLLSSIVITNLVEAREKAYNAKVLTEVHQYVTALELAKEKNGEYPDPGNTHTSYCIGEPYLGGCGKNGGTPPLSSSPNAAAGGSEDPVPQIKEYIPGYPSVTDKITYDSSSEYWGYLYDCDDRPGGICQEARLIWFLKGQVDNCGRYNDLSSPPQGDNITICSGVIGD